MVRDLSLSSPWVEFVVGSRPFFRYFAFPHLKMNQCLLPNSNSVWMVFPILRYAPLVDFMI